VPSSVLPGSASTSDFRKRAATAITVDLEHREGHSMRVLLPYAKERFGGIEYFDLRAEPSTQRVWGQ
jgi:hypothetical protein